MKSTVVYMSLFLEKEYHTSKTQWTQGMDYGIVKSNAEWTWLFDLKLLLG